MVKMVIPFISSSTSFWYQFFQFRLTHCFTYHFSLDLDLDQ